MATIQKILQREDGSEAKIVVTECFGVGLVRSVDVYVLRRSSPDQAWSLCSDQPHPDWRTMSVDEYIRHGRSEMLQTVKTDEILKAVQELNSLKSMPA